MIDDRPLALHARYVFPVSSRPINDAYVVVHHGRVQQIAQHPDQLDPSCQVQELGNVALLPGLINAHTHLQFSQLTMPLPHRGSSFASWIRSVIDYRRRQDQTSPGWIEEAVAQGATEAFTAGTVGMCEIMSVPPHDWPAIQRNLERLASFSQRYIACLELIGNELDRVNQAIENTRHAFTLFHAMRKTCPQQYRCQMAISPHAPYSTTPDLVRQCVQLANNNHCLLAMHLAESSEEMQLLEQHDGPLVELLRELGFWNPTSIPKGTRPLDYLRLLAQAPRSLVVHGNCLSDDELSFVAHHADRMSLVHCPRTHEYFGRPTFPLAEIMARGIRVVVGTDSRASNPDLSIWNEIRTLAGIWRKRIPPEKILGMGTNEAAQALGLSGYGEIVPGARASFAKVPLSGEAALEPYELLWCGDRAEPLDFPLSHDIIP
ncbi:MAG: amidohydrolase family protein [Pirellulaceae bacterium]|nr:amidohydrolase family protein [Planctomycetales bacterium]